MTVNCMVCEVQYGGKITDDWDRRLFNTYGQAWLVPAILDDAFEFAKGYKPAGHRVDAFRAPSAMPSCRRRQPLRPPSNADIAICCAFHGALLLAAACSTCSRRRRRRLGETREEVVSALADDLREKLPGLERRVRVAQVAGREPLNIACSRRSTGCRR